jgi:tyrosine-protein phosphatase YwqE
MKEAFELVKSKYGEKTANEVFFENAKNLLNIG